MSVAITVKINKNIIERYLTIDGFQTNKDSKNKMKIGNGTCLWVVDGIMYPLSEVIVDEKLIRYHNTDNVPKFAIQMQNLIKKRASELGYEIE